MLSLIAYIMCTLLLWIASFACQLLFRVAKITCLTSARSFSFFLNCGTAKDSIGTTNIFLNLANEDFNI